MRKSPLPRKENISSFIQVVKPRIDESLLRTKRVSEGARYSIAVYLYRRHN